MYSGCYRVLCLWPPSTGDYLYFKETKTLGTSPAFSAQRFQQRKCETDIILLRSVSPEISGYLRFLNPVLWSDFVAYAAIEQNILPVDDDLRVNEARLKRLRRQKPQGEVAGILNDGNHSNTDGSTQTRKWYIYYIPTTHCKTDGFTQTCKWYICYIPATYCKTDGFTQTCKWYTYITYRRHIARPTAPHKHVNCICYIPTTYYNIDGFTQMVYKVHTDDTLQDQRFHVEYLLTLNSLLCVPRVPMSLACSWNHTPHPPQLRGRPRGPGRIAASMWARVRRVHALRGAREEAIVDVKAYADTALGRPGVWSGDASWWSPKENSPPEGGFHSSIVSEGYK